ncbi:regulatory protein RecX [Bacteroides sp. 51]|uniref:regulatory protein RecX n=1 Tax=Bacteroides sp. 51 TaxID=2302938 RepID=UPI0013D074A2|nr:regulatory protein RecX [Bacteroides sp. 51]NDV83921.1 RecX family transcriptional regulator [Bacteroides sp. 51]
MSTITEEAALRRMASYCAKSEHSRTDAYEKFKRWGFSGKVIDGMLEALETGGFIDDERFCRSFVNDKFRFNKWGRLKIGQALALHKIPSDIAHRYLSEIDEEEYVNVLQKLINTKTRSVQGKNERDKDAKLIRFAASRGFEMRYIKQCLGALDDE